MSDPPKHIVIAGAGVIGTLTAYYSIIHPSRPSVTLVEATDIASAASGKAGGLLAADWHGPETSSLGYLSFDLHARLAKEHDGREKWGYRELDTVSVTFNTTNTKPKQVPGIDWLDNSIVQQSSLLGTTKTTAQVHPRLFTQEIARIAESKGVNIVKGSINRVNQTAKGSVDFVEILKQDGSTQTVTCSELVLCCGPWTGRLAKKLFDRSIAQKCDVDGYRAHSVVLKSSKPLSAHAIFSSIKSGRSSYHPEFYCRPDGTVYVCGSEAGKREDLPEASADVKLDPTAFAELKKVANIISPTHLGKDCQVVAEQACYLPSSYTGSPLIGKVAGNIYINAGHTCWGISNSAGSGKVMSELILDGKVSSADISALSP